MNALSFLVGSTICAAALVPATHAGPITYLAASDVNVNAVNAVEAIAASGPRKLIDTYTIDAYMGSKPLLPGLTLLDTSAVNCPANAPSCTIGFDSTVQVVANGDMIAICLQVDNIAPICHYQALVSDVTLPPAMAHAQEVVANLAPGPHVVQTLAKSTKGNSLFFLHTDYRVYKP